MDGNRPAIFTLIDTCLNDERFVKATANLLVTLEEAAAEFVKTQSKLADVSCKLAEIHVELAQLDVEDRRLDIGFKEEKLKRYLNKEDLARARARDDNGNQKVARPRVGIGVGAVERRHAHEGEDPPF